MSGNATYGREREQVNFFPTFFNSWSGSGPIEHNLTGKDRLRLNYIKSQLRSATVAMALKPEF